ncbi:unnamed protein product [Arctia plantaginis]|uniref:Uncharacterized protein n=1 Tax=Arctia plantaginis TaxID=874455 RepID=A0A8S1A0K0_ARCPL|nr:unnamed protein product [Arctia plantaginis]
MRANTVGMNKSDKFFEFVNHVKSKGVTTLKSAAKQIFKGMKLQKNFTQQIEIVTDDYKTRIQKYLEHVMGEKAKFTIDEEFVFLDMVETSCRLLYREQKKILNFAITTAKLIHNINETNNSTNKNANNELNNFNISHEVDVQSLSQIIFRQVVMTKREELRHICNKYEICRPYPAFTDYLADFLVEIMKLSDEKLGTFVKALRLLGKTNEDFFNGFIDVDDKETVIVPYFAELLNNLNGFQETLLIIRGLLTQRFKIISSPNLKMKIRTQAVRIILDIINRAFQYENDDLLAMEFDTVVKSIRSWNNGQRHFPESSVILLFNSIFNVLDYNLSIDAKSEVKVLIETLIRGSSKDEKLYSKLFSEGSKYVKGEDIVRGLFIYPSYGGNAIGTLKSGKHNKKTTQIPKSPDVKSKVPKKFFAPLPISPAPFHTYETDRLNDYSKHVMKQGMNIIKYSATKILNQVGNENSLAVYSVTSDYVSKVQEFLDHLKENHGRHSSQPVGEEFMIMNMLEKACEILYQQQWILLSTTPMNSTKANISRIQKLSKFINGQIKQWRKEEMQYICSTFQICKPYPAFSNRVEYLILELLKLPDSKLNIFVDHVKNIVENNKDFLALVGGIQGKDKTFKRINDLCRNKSLKESLTSVRGILSHKFKISQSQSNTKSQATQVLLDIIDKAFLFNRDKSIVLNFEEFDEVIKKWGKNKAQLDRGLLEQLINAILKTINSINNPVKSTLIKAVTWID